MEKLTSQERSLLASSLLLEYRARLRRADSLVKAPTQAMRDAGRQCAESADQIPALAKNLGVGDLFRQYIRPQGTHGGVEFPRIRR